MRDLFSLQHSIFEDVKKDDAAGMEQEFIKELFNDLCLEIGPGKTLAGFIRKINREATVINIEKFDDLEKLN